MKLPDFDIYQYYNTFCYKHILKNLFYTKMLFGYFNVIT